MIVTHTIEICMYTWTLFFLAKDKFFDEQGKDLYKVVALLTENRVLLRTGVTNARYIHHQHADPWLTHSYKINRHEQESAVPFKDSVYAAMRKERTAEVTSETERNGENAVEADETRRDEEEKRVEQQRNNNEVEAKRDEGTSEENHLVEAAADNETKRNGENSENHVVERTDARRESEEEKREKHNEEVVANAASNKEERKESETSGEPRVTRRRSYKHRVCFSPERDLYKPTQQLDFTYVKSLIEKTGEKKSFRSRTIKTTKIILFFFFFGFVLGGPRKSKW